MTSASVRFLAQLVGGELHGDGDREIRGVGDLRAALPDRICFVRSTRYAGLAAQSGCGALLVGERLELELPQIVVADPQAGFAKIALHFHPVPRATEHRVHPTAVVDPSAVLGTPVDIGPHVTIEAHARLGAGTIVRAGCVVGERSVLGENCVLYPRVVLYHGVRLGARVVVHGGTVIGSDGFGYARDQTPGADGAWIKVPQVGGVTIGDDVEIGANSTIDRGTLGDTRIGAGSKLDNVVHIGHNCVLGRNNAIAGFSAFSGSTILGDRVSCAGHVVSGGHLRIADDTRIGGNSVVTADVREAGDYMGYPLQRIERWGRTRHILAHLIELRDSVRRLTKRAGDPGPDADATER